MYSRDCAISVMTASYAQQRPCYWCYDLQQCTAETAQWLCSKLHWTSGQNTGEHGSVWGRGTTTPSCTRASRRDTCTLSVQPIQTDPGAAVPRTGSNGREEVAACKWGVNGGRKLNERAERQQYCRRHAIERPPPSPSQ